MTEVFSKRVENTVGKGEIARYEQFLLFPQCFQKTCTAETLKPGLVWERVKEPVSFISYRLHHVTVFQYMTGPDKLIRAFRGPL